MRNEGSGNLSDNIATPTLYFNSGEDDDEAYKLIIDSNIPCRFQGPVSFHTTPVILWGFREYRGLRQVKRFIREYQEAQEEAA